MDTNLKANMALCDFRWGPDHRFWEGRGHLNFAHCCLFTPNPVSGTQLVLSKAVIDFTAWVCGPVLRHRSSGSRTGKELALSSE